MWLHISYQSLSTIHILFTGCGQHPGEDITLYCKTCGEGACDSTCHQSLSTIHILFTGCGQHPGEDITLYCKTCGEGACGSTFHTNLSLLFIFCLQVVGSIRERISLSVAQRVSYQSLSTIHICSQRISLSVRRVGRARVTPHVIPISLYYSYIVHRLWAASGRGYHSLL